jgi:hypothetical protein
MYTHWKYLSSTFVLDKHNHPKSQYIPRHHRWSGAQIVLNKRDFIPMLLERLNAEADRSS